MYIYRFFRHYSARKEILKNTHIGPSGTIFNWGKLPQTGVHADMLTPTVLIVLWDVFRDLAWRVVRHQERVYVQGSGMFKLQD